MIVISYSYFITEYYGVQIRCLLRLIFWSVLFLHGEMSPSCCSIDENSKSVEVGFFWCCCFCGVSWFCCGFFCEGGSWGSFFVCLFFWFFFPELCYSVQCTHSPLLFSHLWSGKCCSLSSTTHTCPLTSDAQWRLFCKKPILDIKAEFMCGLPSHLLSPNAGVSFEVIAFHLWPMYCKSDH